MGLSPKWTRRAVTLIEVLVAVGVSALLALVLFGTIRHFFSRDSKASLSTATERAFAQKDLRIGLKKLMLRIREGTEILSPRPGVTASELVFRDVLNQKVRLRLNPERQALQSERFEGGDFKVETEAFEVVTEEGDRTLLARPIRIGSCSNVAFTTLSPSSVVLSLTVFSGHVENALMTSIHLRNYKLAY